jgi:hypothetical protein
LDVNLPDDRISGYMGTRRNGPKYNTENKLTK